MTLIIQNQNIPKLPSELAKFAKPVQAKKVEPTEAPGKYDTVSISGKKPVQGVVLLGDTPITMDSEFGKQFKPKETTQFSSDEVSAVARQLSALMDENSQEMYLKISSGMSEKQLAEHFGNIGQKLDAALAGGDISQQEYNDLNAGLEKYVEAISGKAEREAASWEVVKQMAQATRAKIESGCSKEEMAAYAKSNEENFQNEISKFVEKYCHIERSLLNEMINQVRGGKSFFPAGTEQVYKRENAAGYFKNDL